MSGTNRHSRIAHNIFSVHRFVQIFAAAKALLIYLYISHTATFSVYGNKRLELSVIIAIFAGSDLILSLKYERNWMGLMSGTLLPVLMYEAFSMWRYSSVIRTVVIIGGIFANISGCVWAAHKAHRIHNIRIKREVRFIKAAHASRVLCCLVLLGTCAYGKHLIDCQSSVSYSDIAYIMSEDRDGIPDYENSLAANIQTVAKIDPDGGWGTLSLDERTDVLETIVRVECRYLGMTDAAPSLQLAYLKEGRLGEYDRENDVITLSYNYIVESGTSGYSIVQVLCHELYHRYQEYQVGLLQTIRESGSAEKYSNLQLLNNARIFEEELNSYIEPEDDEASSYYLYRSQELEITAERYGDASVADYYEQIHNYLDGIY